MPEYFLCEKGPMSIDMEAPKSQTEVYIEGETEDISEAFEKEVS